MQQRALFFFCFLIPAICFAQVPSPKQFLGYEVGTRFTPHWKIVSYFRAVAAAAPDRVKLEQYGETNEGRPLMVAYVANVANSANLASIREANQKLANDPKAAAASGQPAIVWLSYNVHGNEASSSEASMLTLYALADPANAKTKAWLQNTIVVIDPCLNPDGRDRYVNWFNSIVGKHYDPSVYAREHDEPWPGGRVNHYNFDLNRDWSWQTQVESQGRVKLYNSWLPQIHVDFHEQGINAPYYFAPAAQPYHEVITPWQRDFQQTIGKNHARYFDEKGWLYFTKEEFDLTYPAYGDTYPMYSGAIGMTYEQAGHSQGGLGVTIASGDTLTLVDRAQHHFTTSLSTIEVASQNAGRLVNEFQKFYRDANTQGVGNYKTYIVRNRAGDASRVQTLLALLDRNGIRYGTVRKGSARGFNYATGRDENFGFENNDIAISALQPKSALVKVLFEPATMLVDSLAYDITAWSLPYAYGLQAWATPQRLATETYAPAREPVPDSREPYGLVIPWSGMPSARLVGDLLQKGIRLRYHERPFETGGRTFERGSILVLKTSNQYVPDLWSTVLQLAEKAGVRTYPVTTGFVDKGHDFGSSKIHPMKAPKVALLTGEGVSPNAAGEIWHFFDQQLDYPITLINARDAGYLNWNDFQVVIMPQGNYSFLNEKAAADALRGWIGGGGHLIALEGAVAQLAKLDWGLKSKKEDTSASGDLYEPLKRYEEHDRSWIAASLPGSIFKVELDNTHPLAFGFPEYYYTLKTSDQVYEFIREGGWNVGVLKKSNQVAGFVGSKVASRLQDGLLFGVQDMGRGHITYLADDVLFRSFWENGKQMLVNAVFLVGQ